MNIKNVIFLGISKCYCLFLPTLKVYHCNTRLTAASDLLCNKDVEGRGNKSLKQPRLLCSWYLGKSHLFPVCLKECSKELYQKRSVPGFSTTELLKELHSEHLYIKLNCTIVNILLYWLYTYVAIHQSIFLKIYFWVSCRREYTSALNISACISLTRL